ncbi:PREDICTED: neural cell adhesion molecule 2-like, partial [Cyprinodon variegatus]|uniref:neural cell adhesion molecule 2-like n=1 Tax=Cyprinodon variegatus TaxID=28743 RepID=UPI000742A24B
MRGAQGVTRVAEVSVAGGAAPYLRDSLEELLGEGFVKGGDMVLETRLAPVDMLKHPGSAALQVSISLNKVELSVGESKFFTCTAIGEPVEIEWFNPLGDRMVSSKRMSLQTEGSRSRLVIYNAIIEDAGIYRCQATDASGHTEEASVVLEIYQKLSFRNVISPQEFKHGETAEVVCDVISSPVPMVVWYYQDKEITQEHQSRFQVLPNNNLQIHQVSKADEGVYRCEASVEARGEIDFVDIAVVVN